MHAMPSCVDVLELRLQLTFGGILAGSRRVLCERNQVLGSGSPQGTQPTHTSTCQASPSNSGS